MMGFSEPITLSRDCEVLEIPNGNRHRLPEGAVVRIMQSLGGSYTVTDESGRMYRVNESDAEALGRKPPEGTPAQAAAESELSEKMVWDQLRTIYDPEIPVNLVDLGLIYSCVITPLEASQYRIDVKMSMTAPGCGMGNVLKADVEAKLARLPRVAAVNVEVVFDPPWHPGRMSEAAKLQLGLDSGDSSPLPLFPGQRR
jgi:probable FeS assembly SUF system protein SufT